MTSFQDIVVSEYDSLTNNVNLSFNQIKTFGHIMKCHTEDMGFNSYYCDDCGFETIHYNSCRDRNCPMCQVHQREEWIHKYEERLLDIPYFHLVFTLPGDLNPIIFQNQKILYSLMFKTAASALSECTKKKYGKIGFTFILHTWGQTLSFHPHLHCIVAGGGLTTDNHGNQIFRQAPMNYLVPVKVVSRLFRGKFLNAVQSSHLNFFNDCEKYNCPDEFNALISKMYAREWVVFIKKPFGDNQAVLNYIGRYSHRVAISNNRIIDYNPDSHTMTFTYKDNRDHSKKKEMTLSALEFLRRFSMHILPSHFMKIRHYGFMSNTVRNHLIPVCRELITSHTERFSDPTTEPQRDLTPLKCRCPKCGGKLILYQFSESHPIDSS